MARVRIVTDFELHAVNAYGAVNGKATRDGFGNDWTITIFDQGEWKNVATIMGGAAPEVAQRKMVFAVLKLF